MKHSLQHTVYVVLVVVVLEVEVVVGVYNAELPSTWWITVRPSLTSSVVVPRHRLNTLDVGPSQWLV